MKMRELETQFQNAMSGELQASFERQHREWQHSYQALQQLLEEAKQREVALRMQNEQLVRKLSTASLCRSSTRWSSKSNAGRPSGCTGQAMQPPSTTTCAINSGQLHVISAANSADTGRCRTAPSCQILAFWR